MAVSLSAATPRTLLRIYLNDHLAQAVGSVELAKRCHARNRDTTLGSVLAELIGELARDRRTLERLMVRLELPQDRLKRLIASVGVRAGVVKLNGQLLGYSPLSRLIELEWLGLTIEGKRSLWRTLKHVQDVHSAIGRVDFDDLIARAQRQRDRLEPHRLAAAELALRGEPTPPEAA